MYARHPAQMGLEASPEADPKVRPLTPQLRYVFFFYEPLLCLLVQKVENNDVTARAIVDAPIGEFPRMGEDGYK